MMSIVYLGDNLGVSIADYSTGDFFVTELDGGSELIDEINKFAPSEIIVNEYFAMSGINLEAINAKLGIAMSTLDNWYFNEETCKISFLNIFILKCLMAWELKIIRLGL